jgi:hypothetical protein
LEDFRQKVARASPEPDANSPENEPFADEIYEGTSAGPKSERYRRPRRNEHCHENDAEIISTDQLSLPTLAQPHAGLISIRELDARGLQDAHNGVYRLHGAFGGRGCSRSGT